MFYRQLEKFLSKRLEHGKIEIFGNSVLGRFLYLVKFDFGSERSVIIQAAIHAREHITTDLVCRLIQDADVGFEKLRGMGCPNLIFIPMLNPDGVEICHRGARSVRSASHKKFLESIISGGFSMYKANANGVDLNTNFDARWGTGSENCLVPCSQGYIGPSPMSEPEVQAISCLTKSINPFFTISYHSKGEEVYYQFFNKKENAKRDKTIAKMVAHTLKYKIVNTENVSGGGYKDWCVLRLGIPSVTIEVGSDKLTHPISSNHLSKIYKRNKNILKILPKIKRVYDRERKFYGKGS